MVGQAKRFATEIGDGVKRAADIRRQVVLEGLRRELESMVPRVRQVMRQTNARSSPATPMPRTRLSACSSRPLKLFAKARPASPPNSAKW